MASLTASAIAGEFATQNFVVRAYSQESAQEYAETAEECRRRLSYYWFGKEFPNWSKKVPLRANTSKPGSPASGVTNFAFADSEVIILNMEVSGSHQEIVNSIIPHEVNHTVFATYFRRSLPRWADEGACVFVEDGKHRLAVAGWYDDLEKRGGLYHPSRLTRIMEYQSNGQNHQQQIYGQGHEYVTYLVNVYGPACYIEFVSEMIDSTPEKALKNVYGFTSWDDFQGKFYEYRTNSPERYTRNDNKRKVDVVVFSSLSCGPCKQWKADYKANPDKYADYRFRVVYVDYDANGNEIYFEDANGDELPQPEELVTGRKLYQAFCKETGKTSVEFVPIFWIPGTIKYVVGFTEAVKLLKFLGDVVRKFAAILMGREPAIEIEPPKTFTDNGNDGFNDDTGAVPLVKPTPISPPPTVQPDSVPIATTEPSTPPKESVDVDWGDITFVVLIAENSVSSKVGTNIRAIARGALSRQIEEAANGKAAVYVISETDNPEAYNKIVSTASVNPDPIYIIALVEKQPLGLKSLIAGSIESKIVKQVKQYNNIPVELLFERIHKSTYNDVKNFLMLKTEHNHVFDTKLRAMDVVWALTGLLSGVAGSYFGGLIPSFIKKRLPSKSDGTTTDDNS